MVERRVTSYEVSDGVALLTLRRPERLNAWTGRMEHEYRAAMADADADPGVRVVVVTGEGRGFCAGADTQALAGIAGGASYGEGSSGPAPDEVPARPGSGVRDDFDHVHSFHLGLTKPVIAAVNGAAAGVGFVLMCFADIRFAAAGAKITTSFGRLGLPAEHGVSWLLPRIVGVARAADLLLSSRVVLAEEAERMGLVNRVVPHEELLDVTLDYARTMAAEISPWSLGTMKRQLYIDLLGDLDTSAAVAEALMEEAFGSDDFAEGVAALAAKRRPQFRDRQ
ncbi:MAG TPA: enoyl-CoA hydratase-related protein [Acidimicrobiales bacterium]|nr:enoyl-CoA hydratase-related protein [Acidimicrobiales bacterium]